MFVCNLHIAAAQSDKINNFEVNGRVSRRHAITLCTQMTANPKCYRSVARLKCWETVSREIAVFVKEHLFSLKFVSVGIE